MKVRNVSVVFLSVILFVILPVSVNGSVWNSLYSQAFPVSCEVPKVILEPGTTGTSTIYTNNTSAKVSVSAYVDFEYGYAFKSSNVRVLTTSGTPVDDSEAVLTITLQKDSYVFAIYNAGNKRGSTEDYDGKGCAINIDGADVAFSWQSPYGNNKANSVTVVRGDFLAAGSHMIKGRFFANYPGYTVGIDTRQIAVFWFPSVTAEYVRSTVSVSTTSGTPVDDTEAVLNVTLTEKSIAFIVYNAGNKRGSTLETSMGITLNIDGTDIPTRQWQSPYAANEANSVTIAYAANLTVGSHTIKGRFFSVGAGYITTIDERQLIAFCFPADIIACWFKESTTSISTTSGTPVDDPEAVSSGTLTTASDCLMMYVGGNPNGVTEDYDGKGLLLNIDGTDISNSTSWQSPYGDDWANSVTSLWCEEETTGSHTVKGRFFANYPGYTVTISHRQLLFLAFPKPQTGNYDHVLKVANQVADSWEIRLKAYDQTNIGRLQNCTIYFHDGSSSVQIDIYDGTYNQQEGNWYNLAGSGIDYIAMEVSASSTGASYVYTYLEIRIPSTTTYSQFIITFEIT